MPARQLVPGDIVVLEGGDIVSADMRVVVAGKLQADESVLTGESLPVGKHTQQIDATVSLGDRTNMLYKGTSITRGSGEAVVTATGMETELGKITDLVQKAEDEVTPFPNEKNPASTSQMSAEGGQFRCRIIPAREKTDKQINSS